jgi:LysR family transcriptional regulator for bpeEF and oprC
MDRLQAMQTFTHVVEQGSFSKASLAIGVATPTISRQVQQLEGYLGVALLNRTTRQLSMTPDGLLYYDHCKRILNDVEVAEKSLPGTTQSHRGRLRVDISHALANQLILPAINEFIALYPHIQLTIGLDDRVVDLLQDNIDCAIRSGVPQDSQTLIARRLASFEWITCATPKYLEQFGTPRKLTDLAAHRAVGYFHPHSGKNIDWVFITDGEAISIRMNNSISVNETSAYLACGLQSLGLIRVASYLVQEHLRTGELVALLEELSEPSVPVSAVYPIGNRASITVRAFTEWVGDLFARRAREESALQDDPVLRAG